MANKTTKRRKKKSTARKTTGRRSALATVPAKDLQAEVDRRLAEAHSLRARKEDLEQELADVNARLEEIEQLRRSISGAGSRGASAGVSGRRQKTGRRGRGGKSLADYLEQVLQGTTMGVAEAADAVKAAGYPSSSPNLRTMVNQQLLANKKRFKRVDRGQYTAA